MLWIFKVARCQVAAAACDKFQKRKILEENRRDYGNLNLLGKSPSYTETSTMKSIKNSTPKLFPFDMSSYNLPKMPQSNNLFETVKQRFSMDDFKKHPWKAEEKNDEKFFDGKNNNVSKSTLSLYIAEYERKVEAEQKHIPEINFLSSNKTPLFTAAQTPSMKNPFEFPRQQNSDKPDPEVTQFRASQKLLNPNAQNTVSQQEAKKLKNDEPPKKRSKLNPSSSLRDLGQSIFLSVPVASLKTQEQKTIDSLKNDLNVKEGENQVLNEKLAQKSTQVKSLQQQLRREKESGENTTAKLESQLDDINVQNENEEADLYNKITMLENQSREDHHKIQKLTDENAELKEELQQRAPKKDIAELFVGGKYTPKTKHGLAKLNALGVAKKKVGEVIETVLEMVDLTPNKTPSASTAARASFYLKAINEAQIKEVLKDASLRDITTTLGSDETTKNGKKFEAFVLFTLDEENAAREYCLGMVGMLDKSAATAVEKLKQIIQHLESEEGSKLWETFILTVGNVISDQAQTQKKFNDLLESIKKVIVENDERWSSLDSEQKKDLYKLRRFYCQLHILQNATPVVTNILLEHEKKFRKNDKLVEASVVKLIKEIARYTGERAASKYDVHEKWIQWAKRNNLNFYTVPDFKGHRFNILFAIAASIQFLKEHLLKFDKDFKTKLRDASLKTWMDDPLTSSHLLILAAINEFITAPFWRLTEHDSDISSLTAHAQSLIEFLERVIDDPMLLLSGEPPLEEYEEDFEITERSKAHIRKLDVTVPEHPLIIAEAIEEVAEALLAYFKKQFKDFLPGGDHYEASEKTKTVPKSNRRCESIFGLTTWGFQHAPNQRTAVREAKIMAKVNKVFEWFQKKTPEEKDQIIKDAIAAAPKLENDAAAQVKALEDATWKKLLQQQEIDDKAEKVKTRKEKEAFDKVQKYGGEWKNIKEMEIALEAFKKESEKKTAIIDNLRYHKIILKNLPSKSKRFTITANGKPKPLNELIENLEALITLAKGDTNDDTEEENDEY